jgi:hypothetical protein
MFQQSGGLTSQNMDYDSLKAMILKGILGEPVWFIWFPMWVFFAMKPQKHGRAAMPREVG